MLTYNEQLWLSWKKRISRMKNVSAAWCHKCPHLGRNAAGCYWEPYCPLFPDFADAAEFSERMAAKLALGCESKTPCHGCWRTHWKLCNLRKGYWDCADCFLKAARL